MAFRRDVHIAHKVTAIRTNFSCDKVSSRLKSQLLALVYVEAAKMQLSSSSTNAQVHLGTLVHSRREWRHESRAPQKPQVLVVDILRCALTSSVGSDCFDSLHKNMRIFPGTSVFHNLFHDPSSAMEFEGPADPSNHASLLSLVATSILYADLTVKTPCFL